MKKCLLLPIAFLLAACATQRYGRETDVSQTEAQEFTCREIHLETAKAQEFTQSVQRQRSDINAAHVLGFLGDFGVGNVIEGNEAEASGRKRVLELRSLAIQKRCEEAQQQS